MLMRLALPMGANIFFEKKMGKHPKHIETPTFCKERRKAEKEAEEKVKD